MKLEIINTEVVDPAVHPLHISPKMCYMLQDDLMIQFQYILDRSANVEFVIHDRPAGMRHTILLTRDDALPKGEVKRTAKSGVTKEDPLASQVKLVSLPSPVSADSDPDAPAAPTAPTRPAPAMSAPKSPGSPSSPSPSPKPAPSVVATPTAPAAPPKPSAPGVPKFSLKKPG